MNLDVIQPGSAVYDADGERIGTVSGVTGDRFHLSTKRSDFWIPYEWILLAHARTVLVNTHRADLGQFEHALPSRWLRSA